MKKFLSIAVLALMVLALAVPALADASIVITGGTLLAHDQPIVFEGVTLNGTDHNPAGSSVLPWQADDPTGTGTGWQYQIKAADFIAQENATHTIALTGFEAQLADGTVAPLNNTLSPLPTSRMAALTTLTGEYQTMLSAKVDEGMGYYSFAPNFKLFVPAATYAGHYSSVVNVTMIAGPAA